MLKVEKNAKNLDDALELAARELGVSKEEVGYTITKEIGKGLMRFIVGSEVEIVAWRKADEEAEAQKAAPKAEKSAKREKAPKSEKIEKAPKEEKIEKTEALVEEAPAKSEKKRAEVGRDRASAGAP